MPPDTKLYLLHKERDSSYDIQLGCCIAKVKLSKVDTCNTTTDI